MAFSDFLFQGSPPPNVTQYGTSTTNIPQWLSDYTQGLVTKANAIAGQPYQPYGGPQVAPFSQDQLNAFQNTDASMGIWQTPMAQGNQDIATASNLSPQAAASGALNQASQTLPSQIGNYLNPYTNDVVNQIGVLAGRNLQENLLPALNNQFIGAGQFGSSRNTEMVGRTLRDISNDTLAQQSQALQAGYNTAGQQFASDQSRLAGIGATQGQLTSADQQNLGNLGYNSGVLGQLAQASALKDAAAQEAIGQEQQGQTQTSLNTAYQNYQNQLQYPYQQAGFLNSMIRGIPYGQQTSSTQTAPATAVGPSPLASIAGAGIGALSLQKALGLGS